MLEHVLSESRFIGKVQGLLLQAKGLSSDHKILKFQVRFGFTLIEMARRGVIREVSSIEYVIVVSVLLNLGCTLLISLSRRVILGGLRSIAMILNMR